MSRAIKRELSLRRKAKIYEWLATKCIMYLPTWAFYKPARFFMERARAAKLD